MHKFTDEEISNEYFEIFHRIYKTIYTKINTLLTIKDDDEYDTKKVMDELELLKKSVDIENEEELHLYVYKQALISASTFIPRQYLDADPIIEECEELHEFAKFNAVTRAEISLFYEKVYYANIETILLSYDFKPTLMDFDRYLEASWKVFRYILDETIKGFRDYADQISSQEAKLMSEVYKYAQTLKENIPENIAKYCQANNIDKFYLRNFSIINWIVINKRYDEQKYKKIIQRRLLDLSLSNEDVAKLYLVSLLDKDSNYDRNRKAIYQIVNIAEKQTREKYNLTKELIELF